MNNFEDKNLDQELVAEYTKDKEVVVPAAHVKPTYIDVKDGDGDAFFDPEEYVYLSDGVYIHKDECWF